MTLFLGGCKNQKAATATQEPSEPAKREYTQADFYPKDISGYQQGGAKAGRVEDFVYYSDVMGTDRKAQVYVPCDYDKNVKYPVVYLIHGLGCDSTQWVNMGSAKIFDAFITNGELKPFIAVFPSVIPAEGLDKNGHSETNINAFKDFVKEFVDDLEPRLSENYSISLRREDTAICGLSMGGMEALRLGFTYLDKFNYIGSFSAAPTLEMELLTTEGSEYVPDIVLICSGDKDNTVGNNPFDYHMRLGRNGVKHIWYSHPGGGHDGNVWNLGLVNFLQLLGGGFTD